MNSKTKLEILQGFDSRIVELGSGWDNKYGVENFDGKILRTFKTFKKALSVVK